MTWWQRFTLKYHQKEQGRKEQRKDGRKEWRNKEKEKNFLNDRYAPKNTTSNYMRQKLIEVKGERDESTMTVGDFNTPLSEMDKSSKQ